MKLLVETTGNFMLTDMSQRVDIEATFPAVVRNTPFISQRIALGQLKVLGKLIDDASNEEFLEFLKESDHQAPLAVSSFLSKFELKEATEKGVASKEEPAGDDPTPAGEGPYTEEQLQEIGETEGMDGLRKIADPLGVKGRSKQELIQEILAAQASQGA